MHPSRCVRMSWIVACLAVAACDPGADLPPLQPYRAGLYRLGPGDQVRVIVFGAEQLSGQFRVDDQGNVALPLLGNVVAKGRSPDELASDLGTALERGKYVRKPSVSVEVIAYRPIYVLGEVNKPGQYPYQPGMTMLTGVAVAGGFTYRALEDRAADVRTVDGHAQEGRIAPSTLLAPGDVVKIFERHF